MGLCPKRSGRSPVKKDNASRQVEDLPHIGRRSRKFGSTETDLYVPEEQFLTLMTQVVDVADVVAIAVDVVEDDATRRRPLDIFAQVPCRKPAHSPVGLHRPVYGSESFLRGDDACDSWHQVAPLQFFFNEFPVLGAEFRRIDDQAYFLVLAVADTQKPIWIRERECAQDAHLWIRAIFFDRQPQNHTMCEEA